jgi:hypothetical protein
MAQRKRYTPEQIVSLLRQVEVAVASRKLSRKQLLQFTANRKRDVLAVWTRGGALCGIGPYVSTID